MKELRSPETSGLDYLHLPGLIGPTFTDEGITFSRNIGTHYLHLRGLIGRTFTDEGITFSRNIGTHYLHLRGLIGLTFTDEGITFSRNVGIRLSLSPGGDWPDIYRRMNYFLPKRQDSNTQKNGLLNLKTRRIIRSFKQQEKQLAYSHPPFVCLRPEPTNCNVNKRYTI
jgi:hypothetical protein